jgi:hypothetical protein
MLHACPIWYKNELYFNKTFVWISWTLTDDVDHEWSEHDNPPPTAVWRRRLKTGVQFIFMGGTTGAPPGCRIMRHLTVHHKVANMWRSHNEPPVTSTALQLKAALVGTTYTYRATYCPHNTWCGLQHLATFTLKFIWGEYVPKAIDETYRSKITQTLYRPQIKHY